MDLYKDDPIYLFWNEWFSANFKKNDIPEYFVERLCCKFAEKQIASENLLIRSIAKYPRFLESLGITNDLIVEDITAMLHNPQRIVIAPTTQRSATRKSFAKSFAKNSPKRFLPSSNSNSDSKSASIGISFNLEVDAVQYDDVELSGKETSTEPPTPTTSHSPLTSTKKNLCMIELNDGEGVPSDCIFDAIAVVAVPIENYKWAAVVTEKLAHSLVILINRTTGVGFMIEYTNAEKGKVQMSPGRIAKQDIVKFSKTNYKTSYKSLSGGFYTCSITHDRLLEFNYRFERLRQYDEIVHNCHIFHRSLVVTAVSGGLMYNYKSSSRYAAHFADSREWIRFTPTNFGSTEFDNTDLFARSTFTLREAVKDGVIKSFDIQKVAVAFETEKHTLINPKSMEVFMTDARETEIYRKRAKAAIQAYDLSALQEAVRIHSHLLSHDPEIIEIEKLAMLVAEYFESYENTDKKTRNLQNAQNRLVEIRKIWPSPYVLSEQKKLVYIISAKRNMGKYMKKLLRIEKTLKTVVKSSSDSTLDSDISSKATGLMNLSRATYLEATSILDIVRAEKLWFDEEAANKFLAIMLILHDNLAADCQGRCHKLIDTFKKNEYAVNTINMSKLCDEVQCMVDMKLYDRRVTIKAVCEFIHKFESVQIEEDLYFYVEDLTKLKECVQLLNNCGGDYVKIDTMKSSKGDCSEVEVDTSDKKGCIMC